MTAAIIPTIAVPNCQTCVMVFRIRDPRPVLRGAAVTLRLRTVLARPRVYDLHLSVPDLGIWPMALAE